MRQRRGSSVSFGVVLGLALAAGCSGRVAEPARATGSGSSPTEPVRAGGLRIVYGLDLERAVEQEADEVARGLADRLRDEQIAATVVVSATARGALAIRLRDAGDAARLDAAILSGYADIVATRPCDAADGDAAVCLQVTPERAERNRQAALELAVTTIRARLEARGVVRPSVVTKGEQIVVELPDLDAERMQAIKDVIARAGRLEFKMVADGDPWMAELHARVQRDPEAARAGIRGEDEQWRHHESGAELVDHYLRAEDRVEQLDRARAQALGCFAGVGGDAEAEVSCTVSGRAAIERYLASLAASDPRLAVPDSHQLGFERVPAADAGGRSYWRTYYLRRHIELDGSAVKDASVTLDQVSNRPDVLLELDARGAQRFKELTAANVARKVALVLDGLVLMAPVIQSEVAGGRLLISLGNIDPARMQAEAEGLAVVLRSGALPAPLIEESATLIGPP